MFLINIEPHTRRHPNAWPPVSAEQAAKNRARHLEACIWLDADERISKGQSEIGTFCELRKLYPNASKDDITAPLAAVMVAHGRRSIMKDWPSEPPLLARLRQLKRERAERRR